MYVYVLTGIMQRDMRVGVDGWMQDACAVTPPTPGTNPSEWHHPHHSPIMCMYLHKIARPIQHLDPGDPRNHSSPLMDGSEGLERWATQSPCHQCV